MQVMRLILNGQIDPKTAGLLLYALQTASSNLRRIDFEPMIKTHVVIDPRTVDQTPLGEDPWCQEDFEEEEEYEEDDQEENEQAEAAGQEDSSNEAGETIPQIQGVAAIATRRRRKAPAFSMTVIRSLKLVKRNHSQPPHANVEEHDVRMGHPLRR